MCVYNRSSDPGSHVDTQTQRAQEVTGKIIEDHFRGLFKAGLTFLQRPAGKELKSLDDRGPQGPKHHVMNAGISQACRH